MSREAIVDDKYQYSLEDKDNKVHGWISNDPSVGFWMITPSDEFRKAGPHNSTSKTLPLMRAPLPSLHHSNLEDNVQMFVSTHYAGKEAGIKFENGEPWKKVFGPSFIYLNSVSQGEDPLKLLADAKDWPYNFIQSEDFPVSNQRGSVAGQLLVRDRYINERLMWAQSAYLGLAAPGEVGSWQRESKEGYFVIKNVRPGEYNLYAWVPSIIGDYKNDTTITITAGGEIKMGVLVYEPPRQGPTLWEIGVLDRTAAEFFIPDPYPTLMNRLYNNDHKERLIKTNSQTVRRVDGILSILIR
ncbi:rhamnogalacturonate lyase B-like isoform X2 [Fagus crenata]